MPPEGVGSLRATHRGRTAADGGPMSYAPYCSDGLDGLRDWYATSPDRLPALRAALGGTPYGGELEERLRSLSGLAS